MRALLALVLILSAAGCTTPIVQTDVTRFHSLPPAAEARSFTIMPTAEQVGSLEFQRYAEMVAARLSARGWRPVPAGAGAQALVRVFWSVGAPTTETWQTPSSVYGGMGWGPRSHYYGMGMGFPLGDPFPYWETRSRTNWPKTLAVEITEAGPGDKRVLFEGRATTERGGREIAPLMPYLVEGLFTGFPGSSGDTVRINVPQGVD